MNRSRCVEELRSFVTKLNPTEYKTFVDSILTVRCPFNDTLCENKRLVIIDIVSGRGNPLSQDLLLHHVVDKRKPNEAELQRLFSHCVGLQHPTKVRWKEMRATETKTPTTADRHKQRCGTVMYLFYLSSKTSKLSNFLLPFVCLVT